MTWALKGNRSGQLLTYKGKILVHSNRDDLELLVPRGAKPVWVSVSEADALPIWAHPDLASVNWPLQRKDFRG